MGIRVHQRDTVLWVVPVQSWNTVLYYDTIVLMILYCSWYYIVSVTTFLVILYCSWYSIPHDTISFDTPQSLFKILPKLSIQHRNNYSEESYWAYCLVHLNNWFHCTFTWHNNHILVLTLVWRVTTSACTDTFHPGTMMNTLLPRSRSLQVIVRLAFT